ncbi:unnamed protein product [Dicrocoelium dendriticum]|nr:unnamed protein product [Dicrocoelium dendriticum]
MWGEGGAGRGVGGGVCPWPKARRGGGGAGLGVRGWGALGRGGLWRARFRGGNGERGLGVGRCDGVGVGRAGPILGAWLEGGAGVWCFGGGDGVGAASERGSVPLGG